MNTGVSIRADMPLEAAARVGIEFDFEEVDRRLAAEPSKRPRMPNPWDDAQPERQAEADAAFESMRTALWMIAGECIPGGQGNQINVSSIGMRLLALLYISSPSEFGGGSVKALADRSGVSRQALNAHVEHFRTSYSIHTRGQLSSATRAKYSVAQSRAWAKRKEIERAAAAALGAKAEAS